MFTGLIQLIGEVISLDVAGNLWLQIPIDDLILGESISVNGVCLTVAQLNENKTLFQLSPETLSVTLLGELSKGDKVNLERALLPASRLGGHFVTGHVDQIINLTEKHQDQDYLRLVFSEVKPDNLSYLTPKGSIAVNGVSLTINDIHVQGFEVTLIPETQKRSNLGQLSVGDQCHGEFDMLVKAAVNAINRNQGNAS